MSTARLLALSALLPLTVACQTAFAAQGGGAPRPKSAGLFPPATRAIELRVAESPTDSLAYLVDQLSASSGVSFTAAPAVRQLLESSRTGLGANVTIPADEAWLWVEGLLANQGFSLGALSMRAPQLIAVYAPANRDGGANRILSEVVEADFGLLEDHPALLVQTTLELPFTDVRQLANSLRALASDASLMVVPAGNTNSVVIQGRAREVTQTTSLLRKIDELAGKGVQEPGTSRQGQEGPGGQAPPR